MEAFAAGVGRTEDDSADGGDTRVASALSLLKSEVDVGFWTTQHQRRVKDVVDWVNSHADDSASEAAAVAAKLERLLRAQEDAKSRLDAASRSFFEAGRVLLAAVKVPSDGDDNADRSVNSSSSSNSTTRNAETATRTNSTPTTQHSHAAQTTDSEVSRVIPTPPGAPRTRGALETSENVPVVRTQTPPGSSTEPDVQQRVGKDCIVDGCNRRRLSKSRCWAHGGGHRCRVEGCERGPMAGGLCQEHGGNLRASKKCSVEGCNRQVQSKHLCKTHGGGSRCSVDGCTKFVQKRGLCGKHGGVARCKVDGCNKYPRTKGLCFAHGGGVPCQVKDCGKESVRQGLCRRHGTKFGNQGPPRCSTEGCMRHAQSQGLCQTHSIGGDTARHEKES